MSDRQWYAEYQDELKQEQSGQTPEQIVEKLQETSLDVFDPNNAPVQKHRWIDRGMKLTCESAGHPYHEAWKTSMPIV